MLAEADIISMFVGFLLSTLLYLLSRFLCGRTCAAGKVLAQDVEGEKQAAPASPLDEPAPEPLPASTQRRIRTTVVQCALLIPVVVGCASLAIWDGRGSSPAPTPEQVELKRETRNETQLEPEIKESPAQQDQVVQPLLQVPVSVPGNVEAAVISAKASSGNAGAAGAMTEPVSAEDGDVEEAPKSWWNQVQTVQLQRQSVEIPHPDGAVYYKTAYWGTLTVGQPGKPFSVVFDTGSGHLILPTTWCHTQSCKAHRRYKRSASRTAVDIDYDGSQVGPGDERDQLTVSFGTGEVNGVFVEDDVCLGDRTVNRSRYDLVPHDQGLADGCLRMRLLAAVEMSDDAFKDFAFDGVLGLGLPGLSDAPEFNFMHMVAQAGGNTGKPHTFAVFLAGHDQETSELTLGGYQLEKVQHELGWSPVYKPEIGQWMLEMKSLRVDGERVEFCKEGCRAIVDTGTSLIAVPSEVLPELYDLLMHPASEVMTCDRPGPILQIELEGATLNLEPRDYAHVTTTRSLWAHAQWKKPKFMRDPDFDDEDDEGAMCKAMLMAIDVPEPLGPKIIILGEPVLRRYYTVYEHGPQPRVGFALARHAERQPLERQPLLM